MKKVFFAVPTRNQGWILPEYLRGLDSLDYPKNLMTIFFLVNDSPDDTLSILLEHYYQHQEEYNGYGIQVRDFGKPEYLRTSKICQQLYAHFADLKNYLRERFLETDCDYWFQVDTDTILKPDTLKKLIRHEKGYICGTCDTGSATGMKSTNIMERINRKYTFKELQAFLPGQAIECFWAGGIALIRRDVAETCQYHPVPNQDGNFRDDNLGFCMDVREMGLKCWVDPEVYLEHYMVKK